MEFADYNTKQPEESPKNAILTAHQRLESNTPRLTELKQPETPTLDGGQKISPFDKEYYPKNKTQKMTFEGVEQMDITSDSHRNKIGYDDETSRQFALASQAENLRMDTFNSKFFALRNSEIFQRDSYITAILSNINGTSSIQPVCRQIINEEASNRAKVANEIIELDIEKQKKYAHEHICIIMSTIIAISFIGNVAYGTVAIIFPNQALNKGLNGTFAGIIIAGYPIAQLVFTNQINSLLNRKGKKYTLMLGGVAQMVGLFIFGYSFYIPNKWVYFVSCFVSRGLIGYGFGCETSSRNSFIVQNYPEQTGSLIGITYIVGVVGLIMSPMIGAFINSTFGFTWVFNFNSIVLLIVLAVSQQYIPQDHPVVLPEAGSAGSQNQQQPITVGDLLRRFNVLTVAACTYLAVFCMVIKEAIFEPTFENYFGLVDSETAKVAMIEGYTMIATSVLIALVPDSKKNYNKLTFIGALIFCVAIFVEGPITLIEPPRKEGVYWAASGVALIGIGEAFVMLHSMTALEESLSGVYPASKIGEVSNAMGSLISGANGAGNCSGIIIGAFIFSLYSTHFCLELPSPGFQNTLKDKCDIDSMWAANLQHFQHSQRYDISSLTPEQLPDSCFMACVNSEVSSKIFVPTDSCGWQTAYTFSLPFVIFCTILQFISIMFYQNPNLQINEKTKEPVGLQ